MTEDTTNGGGLSVQAYPERPDDDSHWPITKNEETFKSGELKITVTVVGDLDSAKSDYYLLRQDPISPDQERSDDYSRWRINKEEETFESGNLQITVKVVDLRAAISEYFLVCISKIQFRHLWSVASTAAGKYVSVEQHPDDPNDSNKRTVKANGASHDQSAVIRIKMVHKPSCIKLWYYLKFEIGNSGTEYTVLATEKDVDGVTAENSGQGTLFKVIHLSAPNNCYVVLKSDVKNANGKQNLFLSSDEDGNMKLRVGNHSIHPGISDPKAHPAFLFRMITPL